MSALRETAQALAADAGFATAAIKVKEAPACSRRQTEWPAFDVFVKPEGAQRGRHLFTIVELRRERIDAASQPA